MYTLLTEAPPATGGRMEVMKTVISEESISLPSKCRSGLPPAVDVAVGMALERDKTKRYSSISEFGDALNTTRTGKRLPRALAERVEQ